MTARSRTARFLGTGLLTLGLGLGLAACGGEADDRPTAAGGTRGTGEASATAPGPAGGSGDAAGQPTEVKVALFRYQPAAIEVAAGTTVAWRNDDAILHTVTAGAPGQPSGQFDEEMADKGATASVTFDEPGTFRYFCTRHPEAMRGEVVVK